MLELELENRFYTRAEISEATGIPVDADQFSRNVKRRLKNEGYAYEWKKRRGVQILSRTITPQMELKKLLVERLGMNPQVNALDFAQFILAIISEPGFSSMPYDTKESVISKICGHDIDDATLRNWAKKLYQTNNAHQEKKSALWHTFKDDNGIKRQEPADPDGEDYKAYCAARSSSMKAIEEADEKANASPEIRKMAYGRMITSLYGELGYYYWCPAIELNGMGEDIDEILRLVKEILPSPE